MIQRKIQCPEWALCVGGASCVWDDLAAWEVIYGREWGGIVIAANDIGCYLPYTIDAWVSMHPIKFEKWKALRLANGFPVDGITTWCRTLRMGSQGLADNEMTPWGGGSSGMFTVQVARELGCTRAVLCGIPMTMTPHFAETQELFHKDWLAASGHWRAWIQCKDKMAGWVKSMSGRTQELLGAPTIEWLQEPIDAITT